ncbi:hypothetical protein [Bacillus cereus]|uniref:hypothetical protein n=1 Tax=Bacillus cereus TaxID=1396 RepID=UPI0011A535AF|nr:hypothetical protein [Bacillus cereus]
MTELKLNCVYNRAGGPTDYIEFEKEISMDAPSIDIVAYQNDDRARVCLSLGDTEEAILFMMDYLIEKGHDTSKILKKAKSGKTPEAEELIQKVNCIYVEEDFIEANVNDNAVVIGSHDAEKDSYIRLNKKGVKRLRKMLKQRLAELD